MAFHDAFTILQTADVTRLASFYAEQLGFERGYRWPDEGEPAFLVVTLGSFAIGLSGTEAPGPAGRVGFWLYTDEVDAEVDRLRRAGADVVAEPADMDWGERMATIADPDGNLVHLGQRA